MRIIPRLLGVMTLLLTTFFISTVIAKNIDSAAKKLSLQEAIHLALRENPNVQTSKLSETLQRFNVEIEKWRFKPHFTMSANASSDRLSVAPEASLLTSIDTDIKVSPNDINTRHQDSRVSIKISQPLMRGFGRAVVEASLYDALDQEKVAKLTIENTIRNTITNVINAYLDMVAAEKNIDIDAAALKRAQESVKQTELFIKSGRKAGNEIITVRANVATALSSLENNKNALSQTRYALLIVIGLDPNDAYHFAGLDIHSLIKKYEEITLEKVKKLAIDNDIQYQASLIMLNGTKKRALMLAEDRARPSLNLNLQHTQFDDASLSLSIPIDDQAAKQAILSAKIALQEAEINIKAEKWTKEVNAVNNWKTVVASKRALQFAKDAEVLQEKTYQMSYQKYLHGLIDSLELQTAQFQLIQSQHSLLAAQISYLKSLVQLDMLIGHTLKTWEIEARLG